MQIPYANVNQFLSANLLNNFFQAFAQSFGEGYTRFFYPGFINPELISVSGTVGAITVTVNENASLVNGEGLIATAYSNQTFTLNATSYVSSTSNVTIYIYASVGSQLTSPITITPPPVGSTSYNPELSTQTGYQYNTLTFQWGISTTPPDGKTNILYATAVIPAGASSSTPLTFTPQVAQVSGVTSQIPIFVLTSNSVVSLPAGYALNGFNASLPSAQYPGQVFSFMGPGTIGTTQSYPIVGLLPNGQSLTSITLQANEGMQLVSTGQNWLVADAAPINLQGAAFANYLNVSSATTLTNTQTGSIVLVSGSNYAITLPEPAQNTVFQFISNGATGISIVPPSGVSIYVNNTAQSSINFNDSYALLYANGTNWYVAGASIDIWGVPDNVGYTFDNITVNGSAIVNDLNASQPTSAPAYVATNGVGNYWLAGIGDAAGARWLIGDAGNDQIGFYNDTSTSLVPPNFTGYSTITGPNSETYYLRSALDPSGNFKTIGNIYATDGAVLYPNGVPSNNTAIQIGQNVPAQYAGILINTSGYSNNAIQVNNNSTTEFYIDQNGNVWSQGNVTVEGGMQVYPNGVPTGLNGILIGEPVGGQNAPLFINTSGNGDYAFQINDGSTQLFNVQPGGNLFSSGNATIGGSLTAGSISTGGAISGNTLNLSGGATVGGALSAGSLSVSGTSNFQGSVSVPNATSSSNPVPLGQLLTAGSLSGSPTPSSLENIYFPSSSISSPITLGTGSYVGQVVRIYGSGGGSTLTINSSVSSGSPSFILPNGQSVYSITLPSRQGVFFEFVWDGLNWRVSFEETRSSVYYSASGPSSNILMSNSTTYSLCSVGFTTPAFSKTGSFAMFASVSIIVNSGSQSGVQNITPILSVNGTNYYGAFWYFNIGTQNGAGVRDFFFVNGLAPNTAYTVTAQAQQGGGSINLTVSSGLSNLMIWLKEDC